MSATDALSRTFAALADPTRRAMLAQLAAGPASVTDLAAPHAMSRPAISQHLKVLRDAGLVTQSAKAQWRTNALQPEPLDDATAWVAEQRAIWSARFDRLDETLARLQSQTTDPMPDAAQEDDR